MRNAHVIRTHLASSETEGIAFISALETLQSSASARGKHSENVSLKDRKRQIREKYSLQSISDNVESLRFETLRPEQISTLCYSLGQLEISNSDLNNNVWNVIDNHIGTIQKIPITATSEGHFDSNNVLLEPSEPSANVVASAAATDENTTPTLNESRIYLDLLSGLAKMGVKWKSFSLKTQENMESCIFDLLQQLTIDRKKFELFLLLTNIGNLNISIKELKLKTRIQLSESILLTVHILPNSKSLSELLSSLGMTGLIFSEDFQSHQQHKLKMSFSKIFNLNLHQNKFWKGLQGLGNIGIKWSNSDVNLR